LGETVGTAGVESLIKIGSGKVRDLYAIDDDRLLMVASDRISAYDVVLADVIPDKGRVLTGLSLYFFELLRVPNHLISSDLSDLDLDAGDRTWFQGRAMVVRRAEVIPMECVVRGYLYGSSWREYQAGGGPTTEHLPPGLVIGDRLPEPMFTPSTKETEGHDQNLDEKGARKLIGSDLYEELRWRSIDIYGRAAEHAATRGVILADSKFEFGHAGGELILIDEVLTPDSSRYWPADRWRPGSEVPSFDKQYVRDWLDGTGWDHTRPAPSLPAEVIAGTRARYVEAYERITDKCFHDYLQETP
jgi:phosphoribosylaminoimidazole-succinocarboxamide synthase